MEVDGWRVVSVDDIASSQRNALVGGPFGSNLTTRDYMPFGVPVIRGENLGNNRYVGGDFVFVSRAKAERLSANKARAGDIIFTQRGNAVLTGGQVVIVPPEPFDEYIVSQSQMKLTANTAIASTMFLYYVFRSREHREYLRNHAVTTGVPHTNLKTLRDFQFQLPPLPEQRAIASVLGALDDKIEHNRRTSAALERLARTIFRAWFVDFEPVKAKAAGATAFPSMSQTVFDALPGAFTDSELGLIPKGYEVVPLSSLADVMMGTSPSGKTYNDQGIGTPLVNGPVEFGERFALKTKWTTAEVRTAVPGDLIFCVRGSTTGRRVIADDVVGLGRGVCAIRGKGNTQAFVNQLIDVELPRLLSTITGSVFPSLSSGDIRQFPVVKPLVDVISAFCEVGNNITDLQNQLARESSRLAALRDYLLPKLLSGAVHVGDSERLAESFA